MTNTHDPEMFERVRAIRDIFYANISEPVAIAGDEGYFIGEGILFDKDIFAETTRKEHYPEPIFTLWGEGCVTTNFQDDVECLDIIDTEAKNINHLAKQNKVMFAWEGNYIQTPLIHMQ